MNFNCPICKRDLYSKTDAAQYLTCPKKISVRDTTKKVEEYSARIDENNEFYYEIFRINFKCIFIQYKPKLLSTIYELHPHPVHRHELDCTKLADCPDTDLFESKSIETMLQQVQYYLVFT